MAFTIRWFVTFESEPAAAVYRTVPTTIFSSYVLSVTKAIEI